MSIHVLRSSHCLLANGLLLYVFISADLGTTAGSTSLFRRSQIRALPPGEWVIVECFYFMRIWARPWDQHPCLCVLRSGHCPLVNGLLLYFFISSDPGTAAGSSSLSRHSQIRALLPSKWLIVVFCDFVRSRHGRWIIIVVPAFSDPDIATGQMVYCCVFCFLGSRHGHLIIAFVPASLDPDIAARKMIYCCMFFIIGSKRGRWIIIFVVAFLDLGPSIATR